MAIRPKYECVARSGNASDFYFHFHIHKLKNQGGGGGGGQVLSCVCCTWSWEFLHDFTRFEQLAHAHCPAGASDFVHFVVEKFRCKGGYENISMLLAFL